MITSIKIKSIADYIQNKVFSKDFDEKINYSEIIKKAYKTAKIANPTYFKNNKKMLNNSFDIPIEFPDKLQELYDIFVGDNSFSPIMWSKCSMRLGKKSLENLMDDEEKSLKKKVNEKQHSSKFVISLEFYAKKEALEDVEKILSNADLKEDSLQNYESIIKNLKAHEDLIRNANISAKKINQHLDLSQEENDKINSEKKIMPKKLLELINCFGIKNYNFRAGGLYFNNTAFCTLIKYMFSVNNKN